MTFSCSGIGVTPGIAIGNAHLLQRGLIEVSPRFVPFNQIANEIDRYRQAVASARRSLSTVEKKIPRSTWSEIASFIDTHLLMLADAALSEVPIDFIREQNCAAEWALQLQRDALVKVFDAMDDPYLRSRKDDVDHVITHIQKFLLQKKKGEDSADLQGRIIIAQDLAPADTILLKHQGVAGFVTEGGGPMSHTAILARGLGIPALVGVHHATQILRQGERLIVDGKQGTLLATDEKSILDHYRNLIRKSEQRATSLLMLIKKPAITLDGETAQLMANIELPEDIEATRSLSADGVGLYRTEYLFMNRSGTPDEEEQFTAYSQAVEGLNGLPITIRTLDLGADKRLDNCSQESTTCNPALGLRAIRLCLKEPKLFRPHLRAILRATALGPVKIMIPMLSNLQEVYQIKAMLQETKESLTRDGLDYADNICVGGMIEVPAAALAADAFARELDFLSIGTNDLVQYTLAIDRIDDEVNYLYDPLHPSVLRLIQMVIDAGKRHNIPISMCGEMAGDPRYIPLLLGMGLREFSMQPGSLLEVKRVVRSLDAASLAKQVGRMMRNIDKPNALDALSLICNQY
ncbi:MAG: phosphoenolpyruvate--protein phosphotransferase [Gammaproteobacteria bacterium]|nr:phosphoenolpyruvate--protein phosphotransferase [Gammaproteobacteria bacterium]MCP5406411.1 phosphoenolpyruvate--protein phosphotransferase [Chromatiaceae bacterium]MCP5408079.1 phosphoenolpyruvate--protein phosphotransferase [Chromatiaceae bacterium]MCP5442978.1 phosphoenolpyruvate--protein phosphotransferase [Chromatiaceae bacterium]